LEKIKAGIFSFFMSNIPQEAVVTQRKVVDKFNVSKYPFYQMHTQMRHGFTIDGTWHLNGIDIRPEFVRKIPKKFDFDVIMFLDIDALPLNDKAIDLYVQQAYDGALVGNIQRTNHIQNGEHTFVAPSAMAISVSTFLTIGKPSAIETSRSDVAEEYTWLAEKKGIKVIKYMPLRFEGKPAESDSWALATGMPHYGRQTTFGDTGCETFWHNFQSVHPGQHEKFMSKCEELLNNGEINGKQIDVQQQASS